MYKIINFSSVLEIGFAINALLVIFELKPKLENRFTSIQKLGSEIVDLIVEKKADQDFVNVFGWRNLLFGFANWIELLKFISFSNSLLSLTLLIYSGFNPDFSLGLVTLILGLLLIFVPVLAIPLIILYGLPGYKLRSIRVAVDHLLERDKARTTYAEYDELEKKYRAMVNYIALTKFPFPSFLVRDTTKIINDFEDLCEKHPGERRKVTLDD